MKSELSSMVLDYLKKYKTVVIIIIFLFLSIALLSYIRTQFIKMTYANAISTMLAISNDGRIIFFSSKGGKRLKSETFYKGGQYVYDCMTKTMRIATSEEIIKVIDNENKYQNEYHFLRSNISLDNLREVTVKDDKIILIDHKNSHQSYIGNGRYSIISKDGSTVVYLGLDRQVYQYYVLEKNTKLVSLGYKGEKSNYSCSSKFALTPDGRYLFFISNSTNLTKIDTQYAADIYRYDRKSGELMCVSCE
jgi:hypothetical protein